jgi:hypothetical protein
MNATAPERSLSHAEQLYAIKTWRYLRVAMVALVLGLFASIVFEWWKVHRSCIQTSISAYYYTPVHGFFVGALVAIGTCLVCLKGNTEIEDVLLNLAGMLAPVVALVPTPHPGSCASVLGTTQDRDYNVGNNMFALLTVGAMGLVLLAWLTRKRRPAKGALIGYAAAVVVWLAAMLVFWLARDFFVRSAHYAAAISMFACILVVVINNAIDYKTKAGATSNKNRYSVIAVAMVVAVVACLITLAAGWAYWIIALEFSLIALFAIFWTTQTKELWHAGLR